MSSNLLDEVKLFFSLVKDCIEYRGTAYGIDSDISYLKLLQDTGKYGEFLTYKALRPFEKEMLNFF